jgi:hypothetical protein
MLKKIKPNIDSPIAVNLKKRVFIKHFFNKW